MWANATTASQQGLRLTHESRSRHGKACMPVSKEALIDQWDALAGKALESAEKLLQESELGHQSNPHFWVRLSTLAVMCRTVNHFAAFRMLMANGFIVEARTMARCCYENLFWIGGLKDKGAAFLTQMKADNVASKKALGHELLAWSKKNGGSSNSQEKLETFIDELKGKPGKKIGHQEEAISAGLSAAYTIYRILSGDAAHPSAVSISRHVRDEVDGSITISGPSLWTDEMENLETWQLGCGAFISVCIGSNEVLGNEKSPGLSSLSTEHGLLSELNGKIKSVENMDPC